MRTDNGGLSFGPEAGARDPQRSRANMGAAKRNGLSVNAVALSGGGPPYCGLRTVGEVRKRSARGVTWLRRLPRVPWALEIFAVSANMEISSREADAEW